MEQINKYAVCPINNVHALGDDKSTRRRENRENREKEEDEDELAATVSQSEEYDN